jgi:hypothetical protein
MNESQLQISKHVDMRGELIAIDNLDSIPFHIARLFFIQKYSNHEVRGDHAHFKCQQFLIILNGSVDILLNNCSTELLYSMN